MNLSQQSTNANHQLPYHHFQPLMNESASSPSVATSASTAASIISRPSSHHHYESHLYGTLAGQPQRLKSTDQKKASGNASSTWKRLLSTMRLRSNEAQQRLGGQNYHGGSGGVGRPNLTLHSELKFRKKSIFVEKKHIFFTFS